MELVTSELGNENTHTDSKIFINIRSQMIERVMKENENILDTLLTF